MFYHVCRLQAEANRDFEVDSQILKASVESIEWLESYTWKLWFTTQVISADENDCRLQSLNGKWKSAKKVAKSVAAYVEHRSSRDKTVLTLLSAHQDAFESIADLLSGFYEQASPVGLSDNIQSTGSYLVEVARLTNRETGDEVLRTYSNPHTVEELNAEYPPEQWDIHNISARPQIDLPVKVRAIFIDNDAQRAGFSIDEDEALLGDEVERIHKILELTDYAFGTGRPGKGAHRAHA